MICEEFVVQTTSEDCLQNGYKQIRTECKQKLQTKANKQKVVENKGNKLTLKGLALFILL